MHFVFIIFWLFFFNVLSLSLSPSLLRSCHGVLYKQLSSWIVHGSLRDDFNEFFIATAPAPPPVRGEEEEKEEEEVQEKQVRHHQLIMINVRTMSILVPSFLQCQGKIFYFYLYCVFDA